MSEVHYQQGLPGFPDMPIMVDATLPEDVVEFRFDGEPVARVVNVQTEPEPRGEQLELPFMRTAYG